VVQSVISIKPLARVQRQKLVDEVTGVLVLHIGFKPLLHSAFAAARDLKLLKEVKSGNSWPHLLIDRPTQLGDQGQLVLLSVALHDRTPGPHLCHDAARSPHVHCWPIVALAEKELGRAIPEGHHSVCVPVRLVLLVDGDGSGQTKVSQLQDALLGDQDVGRLHVSVDDLVGVDEVETFEHLLHHLLDLLERELDVEVAEQACQVVLTEVEDQVESCFVPIVCSTDLDEIDNVVMVQQLENANLSEGCDRKTLLLVLHQHLLQGDNLLGVSFASGLEDLAKGALSNLGNLLILVRLPLAIGEVELFQVAVSVLRKLSCGRLLCLRGRLWEARVVGSRMTLAGGGHAPHPAAPTSHPGPALSLP